MTRYPDLNTPTRILLGPGPSMVDPRVLRAMAQPLIGHLDPQFIALMNEVQDLLRSTFQTANPLTIPVSGTGSAGMEAAVCNFVGAFLSLKVATTIAKGAGLKGTPVAARIGRDILVGVIPLDVNVTLGR